MGSPLEAYSYPNIAMPVGSGPIRIERSGLRIAKSISLHVWENIGEHLRAAANSSTWWIADWLVYGEDAFPGRYREAIEKTGLNYQTLRNYSWVARRFELSRRCAQLTFGHHAEVTALKQPEQDYWLRMAEENDWSRNRLRNEVRASLKERGVLTPEAGRAQRTLQRTRPVELRGTDQRPALGCIGDRNPTTTLNLLLTGDQYAQCQDAAMGCGRSVEEWAIRTLLRNS